jgi:hypothetical protein
MEITKPLHLRLAERLDEEVGKLPRQDRGYAFEKFLDEIRSLAGDITEAGRKLRNAQTGSSASWKHCANRTSSRIRSNSGSHE